MLNIFTEIKQWANKLPYWEQFALNKIIKGEELTESDYGKLLRYLLEDEKLEPLTEERPTLQFSNDGDTISSSYIGKVKLLKIFNMKHVNALVPGQTLTFGPALTTVFGENGSGKSGYARVFGCIGFTRGDKELLPDITQTHSITEIVAADIEMFDGTLNKTIHHQVGNQEVIPFYVFDSTSVQVHLTKSNMFSFSPAGLSYLTKLADVTDKVRERLNTKIEEYSKPHNFNILFQGESIVAGLIANLKTETSLEDLKQMAILSPEEEQQIENLSITIAELKTKNIPKQLERITQTIKDLNSLINSLREMDEKLSDGVINDIKEAIKLYTQKKTIAQNTSVDQFKSEHFTQTGSEVWHTFIKDAGSLAKAEQISDEKPYPQVDDHCLLCNQSLSREARELLSHLWTFLEGKAQIELDEAQTNLTKKRNELNKIDFRFFDNETTCYRYLQECNPILAKQLITFIKSCCQRRDTALRIINTHTEETIPQILNNEIANIEEIIKTLGIEIEELTGKNPTQEIIKLEQQLLNLQHRQILRKYFLQIEDYIQKYIWAQKVANIVLSTRHITTKHNELFDQLVTKHYKELFEQTLKDLKRPIKVKVTTTGQKGETCKQIVLESAIENITPDKVLSEGEKRAVALADFLTEVSLDINSSGIILDDPITSLDLEWRELIASILVERAKHLQVIIFTHDLPFLYFLKKYAEDKEVEIVTHWIKRGGSDNKPGYVFLDNSPALERDYRKATRSREICNQAKDASAEEQQNLLRQGFGALRTSYEAFIIFDIFQEVVMRFDERISFGRLKNIVWDKSIIDEVVFKCELLSRYIEAHLHSDAFTSKKPTCEILIKEIDEFDALRKKLNALKK
ncbi:MAG: hypothetical protein WC614_04670 [bacterium]